MYNGKTFNFFSLGNNSINFDDMEEEFASDRMPRTSLQFASVGFVFSPSFGK